MKPRPILVALKGLDDWEVVVDEQILPNRFITASKRYLKANQVKLTESFASESESISATVGVKVSNPKWSYLKRVLFLIKKKYANCKNR